MRGTAWWKRDERGIEGDAQRQQTRPGCLRQAWVDPIARLQLAAEGNRERQKGQMGEPASEPGPVDGDYTGARFSILGICIVLPVNFNG